MIDEYFDLSKILNEEERIQALNDELKRRIEAKELKNAKLGNSQNSKQSKKKKSDERTHSLLAEDFDNERTARTSLMKQKTSVDLLIKDVKENEKITYYKSQKGKSSDKKVQRDDDLMEIISSKSILSSQEWEF